MRTYFEVDTCPINEPGVSVQRGVDYMPAMREEAERFKKMVEETVMQDAPEGTWLSINCVEHDFGPYLEMRLNFDEDIEEHVQFMLWFEVNLPETWEDTEVKKWRQPNPIP